MAKVLRTLKVTEIGDVVQDKNGRDYKRVTLSGSPFTMVLDEDTNEVIKLRNKTPQRSMNSYKESYLDNRPDMLWNAELGESVGGSIESRIVDQAYEIDARTVSSYSMIVLGDTSRPDWEAFVNKEFYRAGHRVAGDNTDYETPGDSAPETRISIIADEDAEEVVGALVAADIDEEPEF